MPSLLIATQSQDSILGIARTPIAKPRRLVHLRPFFSPPRWVEMGRPEVARGRNDSTAWAIPAAIARWPAREAPYAASEGLVTKIGSISAPGFTVGNGFSGC